MMNKKYTNAPEAQKRSLQKQRRQSLHQTSSISVEMDELKNTQWNFPGLENKMNDLALFSAEHDIDRACLNEPKNWQNNFIPSS